MSDDEIKGAVAEFFALPVREQRVLLLQILRDSSRMADQVIKLYEVQYPEERLH